MFANLRKRKRFVGGPQPQFMQVAPGMQGMPMQGGQTSIQETIRAPGARGMRGMGLGTGLAMGAAGLAAGGAVGYGAAGGFDHLFGSSGSPGVEVDSFSESVDFGDDDWID
ncbi:unnamed protein product, partial [Brenthis ino]